MIGSNCKTILLCKPSDFKPFFLSRFTLALGKKNFPGEGEEPTRKWNRLSSPPPLRNSIYSVCQLRGKNRVKHKNKRYTPYKITRFDTASRIKSAAKTNNPRLYNEIAELDLITKEFNVHKHCYKKFTLKPLENVNVASDANSSLDNESTCYSKSNYEDVKEYIRDVIIKEKRLAFMELLHDIYGLGIVNSSYRHKLKTRF